MIVRELVTKLGFDADKRKVDDFEKSIGNLVKGLTALVTAAKAASAAAFALANSAAQYGDEVAKTSRTLGMGVRELQQYRFAFDRVGVGQNEVTNGLERLSRNLGQAAQGIGSASRGFDALGINIRNSDGSLRQIRDIMPEIIDGLSSTEGEAQAAAIAADLFGRSGIRLGRALRQGRGELAELIAEYERLGGGMSEAEALASEGFVDAMTNMNIVLQNVRLQIGTRLYPIFQEIIEAFTDFVAVNRELILMRITRVFEVLIRVTQIFLRVIGNVLQAMDRVANLFGGWERTLKLIAVAISTLVLMKFSAWIWAISGALLAAARGGWALNAALLALHRIPIIALFAGIVLLLEDIYHWVTDGDSVLGEWLGTWDDFKVKVDEVTTAVMDYLDPLFRQFEAFSEVLAGAFTLDIDRIMNGFRDLGSSMREWATQLGRDLAELIIPPFLLDFMGGRQDPDPASVPYAPDSTARDQGPLALPDVAGDVRSSGSGRREINVNARIESTLQVPEGTPEEQRRALRDESERTFERLFEREINRTLNNMPGTL